uniref:Uncharacterized protein n=1 Tax=Glossina austeni TaxID=7395 RepID=A0A1A9UV28_GLOAU
MARRTFSLLRINIDLCLPACMHYIGCNVHNTFCVRVRYTHPQSRLLGGGGGGGGGVISLSFINEQDLDFMLRNHIKDLQARTQLCDGLLCFMCFLNALHIIRAIVNHSLISSRQERLCRQMDENTCTNGFHRKLLIKIFIFLSLPQREHLNERKSITNGIRVRATNLKCHECNSGGDYTYISSHDACEH